MGLGPVQGYLAKFNSYVLPGYVQNESFDSGMSIAQHYAPFADGSLSEQTGLTNKQLTLRLKVWESDYAACKEEVNRAATMLRSNPTSFSPLYVQYDDRYYEALTPTIRVEKAAGTSVRTLEYESVFECKPWLIGEAVKTVTGTGTIDTDQVSRTIDDGGWTPTTITISGTNVTVSGYTETGQFTGFFGATGAVSNLVIDSDAFTAKIGATNKNGIMTVADYRVYAGPGKTFFAITGASSCTIEYHNRWYL